MKVFLFPVHIIVVYIVVVFLLLSIFYPQQYAVGTHSYT